ncbi:hypothetical protein ACIQTT_06755 [Microbacterium sp. NPDC090225]|uniref:hypothetical protein n=1 Tax=Microbacterium sp. NPDC090225 TaxID=3364207 RepID=UPI0038045FE4
MSSSIDRAAVVARHRIRLTSPDPQHVLTVGNGDFGFTSDITGLQTFANFHDPERAMGVGAVAVNTATMSNWGWHEMPNPEGYTLDDATTTYETERGPVRYADKHDMMSAMSGTIPKEFQAGAWLNANPQRVDLGRIGFELRSSASASPATDPSVLSDTEQTLDLWTGVVDSSFRFSGEEVRVRTLAAPDESTLAFRVVSPLLRDGRARVVIRFPYASDGFFKTDDWHAVNKHQSELDESGRIRRKLDDFEYVVETSLSGATLEATAEPHVFVLLADGDEIDAVVRFSALPSTQPTRSFDELEQAAASDWEQYWTTGAMVDLSGSADSRAHELERRIVLSQYLTRVHGSGHLPPQETGLVTNSWQGKFHLEMHLWHAAHFAVWGRPELLERSLRWYLSILGQARQTAAMQGYPGARWPKQTAPDGRESPSDIGALLVWQQPHILHMLELVWQASDVSERTRLVAVYGELVDATAEFMAAFANEKAGTFHLGPPIMPAQEFYDARTTVDPTFELAYWWWGLDVAQAWRERAGLPRNTEWQRVQDGLASPGVADGKYTAVATSEPLRRDDHPSLLMAYGVVPGTPIIDPALMRTTFDDVWGNWEWPTAWGWDFPAMTMTATRLGDTARAIDALLRNEEKNQYTAVGHNPQMRGVLPLYLPGNGGLLLAVALLAQEEASLPDGWVWRVEGFRPFPAGVAEDPQRHPQEITFSTPEAKAPAELTAETSIGDWLDDPVGGEVLRGFLAKTGTSAENLTQLRGVPLQQLVALSQGQMPQAAIEALVSAVICAGSPD